MPPSLRLECLRRIAVWRKPALVRVTAAWLCASMILVWLPHSLSAQLTRGTISGVVTDPSGARVQSAVVRIVEVGTNLRRETLSNGIGIFRLSAIEPGLYDLEIQAAGFKLWKFPDLRVRSGREIALNPTLSLLDAVAVIDIQGTPVLPELLDISIAASSYFGREAVAGAPLLNLARDPQLLAVFMPMVSRAPGFSGLSAGGQRSRNQNFILDGTDNNEISVTGSTLRLIPEEVSELQVQFPSFAAEFGQSTGAQISAITSGGTNALHASVWDYFRADWLEPRSLLDKRAGFRAPPRFVQNQAGASLGGPIQRDRTFFYTVLEANRSRQAASTRAASFLTIPTRAGDAVLRTGTVPLGAGQSAASRQQVLERLSFLPAIYDLLGTEGETSTRTVNSVPIEFQTLRVPLAAPSDLWHGLFRGDQTLGDGANLSYRFLLDKRSQQNVTSNLQFADRYAAASEVFSQSHTVSLTHAFNPSWITEGRFSFVRSSLAFPENDPVSPTVQVLGAFTFGGLSNFPQGRVANTFHGQSLTSYHSGKHLLKFGADLRRSRLYNLFAADQKGTWTFNNFTDYLNSQPSRLRHLLTDSTYDARQANQAYFIQDDLRLAQNLSFNAGLRYEVSGVPFGFFGTADPALRLFGIPGPTRRDTNNLAPRLGLAYAPRAPAGWLRRLTGENQTVIRAGFGMNYDVIFLNVLTITAGNYPRALKYDVFAPEIFNLFPLLLPRPAQLPEFDPVRFPFANTPSDLQHPTSHNWLLVIRRQFEARQFAEIGYTGNRTYHLLRQGERNPGLLTAEQAAAVIGGGAIPSVQQRRLNPAWASRATLESTAVSKYHALFLRHQQSVVPGLTSDINLTWSGTFSDNDESLAVGDIVLSSPQLPQNVLDYRSEWSRSVFDRPLRVSSLLAYEPAAKRSASPVLGHLLAGWRFAGSAEWQSGQPFTVVTGVDSGGSGIPVAWRPDLLPGGSLLRDPVHGDLRTFKAINLLHTPRTAGGSPLASSMPEGGNLGRNTFRGPAFLLGNLNVTKFVQIRDSLRLQLRGDFLNVLNHRNFGNPVSNLNSSAFGSNTTDPGNRSVLLSAKLSF